jgi:hypothetical protein
MHSGRRRQLSEIKTTKVKIAILQDRVTMKGVNGTEIHITRATGRKTVKNMKTMQIIQHTINGCVLG